jgi:hypothetical protein
VHNLREEALIRVTKNIVIEAVLRSRSRKEPHLLVDDAALAPTDPAPTMVLNMVGNGKLTQNVTVYVPFSSYFEQ